MGEVWETSDKVRTRMAATRSSGTRLELRMRRELTDLGVRYRLQTRPVPELRHRADFVFAGARVVVDLRGCYWHACEVHCVRPKTNVDRWAEKFAQNKERDRRVVDELTARGWTVVVVWEHDDLKQKAAEIAGLLRSRR
ncbi:DNA mismatch endonuclease Vsr [Microbacterium sp. ProA8]|uniref:DNA mismatch endonuclease Vsr n=1 Tax=Microbacterium chionoecetis TaxID=3153754 RepID=UPI003264B732